MWRRGVTQREAEMRRACLGGGNTRETMTLDSVLFSCSGRPAASAVSYPKLRSSGQYIYHFAQAEVLTFENNGNLSISFPRHDPKIPSGPCASLPLVSSLSPSATSCTRRVSCTSLPSRPAESPGSHPPPWRLFSGLSTGLSSASHPSRCFQSCIFKAQV